MNSENWASIMIKFPKQVTATKTGSCLLYAFWIMWPHHSCQYVRDNEYTAARTSSYNHASEKKKRQYSSYYIRCFKELETHKIFSLDILENSGARYPDKLLSSSSSQIFRIMLSVHLLDTWKKQSILHFNFIKENNSKKVLLNSQVLKFR